MCDPVYHGLTVPGSVLLAGEYAVLTEGGLGLALAVEPRVTATWQAGDCFRITSHFADRTVQWTAQDRHQQTLLDCAWHQVNEALGHVPHNLPYHVTLDSTALAQANGRKFGLGSSGAAAVAATAALWHLVTRTCPEPDHALSVD